MASMTVARSVFAGRQLAVKPAKASAARSSVVAQATARPVWYPGNEPPAYLDGSLPGDFGFDPLRLGSDPEALRWFQQAELQHARWAMLGLTGILVPEILDVAGVADFPLWTEAATATFWTDPLTLFLTQMLVMHWAETRRWMDYKNPGSCNKDPIFDYELPAGDVGYPGGQWFDPFGMSSAETMADLRQKEIKNGRLAMVSIFGFATQTFATGVGPVHNLVDHLADPYNTTIFQTFGY
jgi:light-harvesting complex I chlorophyll a/b binding protein 2